MWTWIKANAHALEALGAVLVAVFALAALIGVKLQVDATSQLQKEQAAREIYSEFLALSVRQPALAAGGYCDRRDATQIIAYENYVEYLLYTAEQVIDMDQDWETPIRQTMKRHGDYICARNDWTGYPTSVLQLIEDVRADQCVNQTAC